MKDYDYDDFDDFDMDYEWVYDENLNKHKRKDKIKWIITAIALLLISVVLVGVCIKVFWKLKEQTDEPPITESKVLLASTRIAPEAYSENGIDPRAVTAYTITATVEPEGATNKEVTWSVDWKEPSSGWANGKSISDYITLNSTTANPVTVTCKKNFGAQAVITCTSQDNDSLSASCTVDYRERITGIDPEITVNGTKCKLSDVPTLPFDDECRIDVNFSKSIGSIAETYTTNIRVELTTACKQWLDDNHSSYWGSGYNQVNELTDGQSFFIYDFFDEYNPNSLFLPDNYGGAINSSMAYEYFYSYLLPEFNDLDIPKLLFTVTLTDSRGNKTEYEYEAYLELLTVAATSLSISSTGIIF